MIKRMTTRRAAAALFMAMAAFAPALQAQTVSKARIGLHTSAGSCVSCDLSGKNLPQMTMRDANFKGSSFNRANLSGGRIYGSDLSETQFRKAFLARVEGHNIKFSDAKMQDVTLVEATLNTSVFTRSDLRRADLARGTFKSSNFNAADLSSATAPGVNFEGSHFIGARFDHANLQDARLDKGIFSNVKFGYAVLRGATMAGADFSGADMSRIRGLAQSQLDTACGDPKTNLPAGLSMPYCDQINQASVEAHDHSRMSAQQKRAAVRLDRASNDLEFLMSSPPESEAMLRRQLEKIHSQINAARREIER